jgi:hypothetical protein
MPLTAVRGDPQPTDRDGASWPFARYAVFSQRKHSHPPAVGKLRARSIVSAHFFPHRAGLWKETCRPASFSARQNSMSATIALFNFFPLLAKPQGCGKKFASSWLAQGRSASIPNPQAVSQINPCAPKQFPPFFHSVPTYSRHARRNLQPACDFGCSPATQHFAPAPCEKYTSGPHRSTNKTDPSP